MYSYDNALTIPYQNNVSTLIHERCFRDIVGNELFLLLKYVIRLGNSSVHTNARVKRDEAILSLRNLFEQIQERRKRSRKNYGNFMNSYLLRTGDWK